MCKPTYLQDRLFHEKSLKKVIPFCVGIPPHDHQPSPISPNPRIEKLTLSNRNSNHSKEYSPSSDFEPHGVLCAASVASQIPPQGAKMILQCAKGKHPACRMPKMTARAPEIAAIPKDGMKLTPRNQRTSTHFSRDI